ncbi:MAG: Jag N-terminal domain-containing protein, partial [Oscillospiraceae bacterium]
MRNEAIATGRTVDAAIEAAGAKLGLEREEVEIEVLGADGNPIAFQN